MVFSTLTYVLIKLLTSNHMTCTEQYANFKKLNEPKTKDSLYTKGVLSKSKFHRSAQDRTPPIINDSLEKCVTLSLYDYVDSG